MAERAGNRNWAELKWPFTMRALWRLAIWGTAAAASLLVAVLAGFSERASQRMMAARAAPDAMLQALPSAIELARDLDVETRRLAESVRVLSADRDRLAVRVALLERNLEDVTGSIKQQAAISGAPTAGPAGSLPVPAAGTPPAPGTPKAAALAPTTPKDPARAPTAATEARAKEQAASAAAAGNDTGAEPAENKTELGVDLGGATNFEALRTLWNAARSRHAALFEGLHPVVAARENGRSKAVELRLIVGPLASAQAAARLCAKLRAARRHCQPATFEGKRLVLAEVAPESKPTGAPKAASAPRSAWPFR